MKIEQFLSLEVPIYVIDLYNKFQRNQNVVYITSINGISWCIREIYPAAWEWGQPELEWEEQQWDFNYEIQNYYLTFEEAKKFLALVRRINRK